MKNIFVAGLVGIEPTIMGSEPIAFPLGHSPIKAQDGFEPPAMQSLGCNQEPYPVWLLRHKHPCEELNPDGQFWRLLSYH